MIYYIFYEWLFKTLSQGGGGESYFVKALNVFQYVTFRTAYGAVTALLISLVFGGRVIEYLRRLNVGQMIREEGPQAHQAKRGTPTMGGVLIVGSVLISTLLWARLSSLYVWIVLVATTGFGVVGFLDDYLKVTRRQSLGLQGRWKLAGQLAIAVGVWGALFVFTYYGWADYSWKLSLPFFKQTALSRVTDIGPVIYLPFIALVLLGFSNAVNLTLQVSFFKMTKRSTGTGRRLFRMTPLHHHFVMSGWKEPKIVFRFLIIAILFALLSLSTLKLR